MIGRRLVVTVAAMFAVAAATITASAQTATAPWFWSKERAALVGRVPDQPAGCSRAIYKSGLIGNCVSPNYAYGGPGCVGVGPRVISATEDVYLYKKFNCRFAVNTWTVAGLTAAYRQMAERLCAKHVDAAAYDVCLQAALEDRVGTARTSGGLGGPGLWLGAAATKGTSTLRIQVTGRFTGRVTWLGRSWKKTIQPTG